MTRDEYIDIARKAGFEITAEGKLITYGDGYLKPHYMGTIVDGIKAAIDIATLKEREACAKVCEQSTHSDIGDYWGQAKAAAIRARGKV